MQSPLRMIYPSRCASCGEPVESDFGLCGACWGKTPFITGLVCDTCGTPLPGESDHVEHCDECLAIRRPWSRGRAALVYRDNARRLVLALKHGDRLDLARPAAGWMLHAARDILLPGMVAVPVPAHWTRMLARRYNQAAELGRAVARAGGMEYLPDALIRPRRTPPQENKGREARFAALQDAVRPHPRRGARLEGKRVLLIDDVMTSGATLAACAEAAHAAGACDVFTLVLARVEKEG